MLLFNYLNSSTPVLNILTGVCIFEKYQLLVGWGKNMMIHKEKNVNFKLGENGKFSLYVLRGKIIILKKRGGGQKYDISWYYTPLYFIDP